jgi:hypothetical protein
MHVIYSVPLYDTQAVALVAADTTLEAMLDVSNTNHYGIHCLLPRRNKGLA